MLVFLPLCEYCFIEKIYIVFMLHKNLLICNLIVLKLQPALIFKFLSSMLHWFVFRYQLVDFASCQTLFMFSTLII